MSVTGSSLTCLPVSFDRTDWESAIFFQLSGKESKQDRRVLSRLDESVPVAIDADIIKHANAAVIVIRVEVYTSESDPLTGEVLLTPGEIKSHFETVRLLSKQPLLKWYFGDAAYWVIHSQQNQLSNVDNSVFADVLDVATRHDALIRMTGRYNIQSALNEVVSHYEFQS